MNDLSFDNESPKSRLVFTILLILFSFSLALNVWLGARLRSQLSQAAIQSQVRPRPRVEAAIGGSPRFTRLTTDEGSTSTIDSRKDTLIYVFSPTCRFCNKNEANIRDLTQQLGQRYEIVGLVQSRDGLHEYLQSHPQPFRVVIDDDPSDLRALDFHGTPQTIILSHGTVIHNWIGVYDGQIKASMDAFFSSSVRHAALTAP